MKKYEIASFIGILISVPSLFVAIALMQPEMPQPPDFTKAEMAQRVEWYVSEHLKTCEVCREYWSDVWKQDLVVLCKHNLEARQRALTVGNWKYTWRGWVWVGKPYPNYQWSVRQQKWCKIVADGRKLKGS